MLCRASEPSGRGYGTSGAMVWCEWCDYLVRVVRLFGASGAVVGACIVQ